MAVAHLLGFDLCPRLRNLSERKLYLPRAMTASEGLDKVIAREISLKAIRDGWDELLRLVVSIRSGRVSAIVALQRLGSAAQGDRLYRAADQLGKLLRTLFLCDYFSNAEFRRELHTLLDRADRSISYSAPSTSARWRRSGNAVATKCSPYPVH